jgi:hypothetical protein
MSYASAPSEHEMPASSGETTHRRPATKGSGAASIGEGGVLESGLPPRESWSRPVGDGSSRPRRADRTERHKDASCCSSCGVRCTTFFGLQFQIDWVG